MIKEQLYEFQILHRQLKSVDTQISTLSSSQPDQKVSEFKSERINLLIARANDLLGKEYRPFEDSSELRDDATYGDVMTIIGQYLACLKEFRARNIKLRYGKWHWVFEVTDTKGKTSEEYVPIALEPPLPDGD